MSKKIQTIPLYLHDNSPNPRYSAMPITEAQLNHLHRLLGWVRIEFNLHPAILQGKADGHAFMISTAQNDEEREAAIERANTRLSNIVAKVEEVPLAVRGAIDVLQNAISSNRQKNNENEVVALRTFINWFDEWLSQQTQQASPNAVALPEQNSIAKYVFNGVKQMKKAIDYYEKEFSIC